MSFEEEQGIIDDEPLKVLGLFHKRDLSMIAFDEQKFLKLYDSLCCTICRQLFNNPVYLRCSHRFCKQCIEKYIRINQKKSCPNCRGDLNTKRDLRIDYGLTSLIHYAYGDRQKFIEDVTQIQNAEAINLQRSNSQTSAIVRTKSLVEEERKIIKKKVKVNEVINVDEIVQQKPKKRRTNTKSFDSSKAIQESSRTEEIRTDMMQSPYTHDKSSKYDQEQTFIKNEKNQLQKPSNQSEEQGKALEEEVKIKKKRGRRKQIPIIEVKSHSSEEPHQMIETTPMELEEKSQSNRKQQRIPSFTNISVKQKTPQKIIEEAQTRFQSFEKQRKLLQEEFGDKYMLSLMKVPIIDFLIEIKLEKHPLCFLTPVLSCKSIQISSKTKIHHIFVLLSKLLNLPIKNINLFVNSQKITLLPYILHKDRSLGEINQNIWKSSSDIQVFDMKEILSSLQDIRGENNKQRQTYQKKKLFEGIEFERQQRTNQPRKRGRGRSKKHQDKQNTIEGKEQVRRILYYKIVHE